MRDCWCEIVHPKGIYERSDVPVRRLEGLEQSTGLLYGAGARLEWTWWKTACASAWT